MVLLCELRNTKLQESPSPFNVAQASQPASTVTVIVIAIVIAIIIVIVMIIVGQANLVSFALSPRKLAGWLAISHRAPSRRQILAAARMELLSLLFALIVAVVFQPTRR